MAAVAKLQIEVQALRKQLRPAKNYSEYAAAHQKSDHVVELERLIQRAGPDDVAELHNHSASHDAIDHVARIHDMITVVSLPSVRNRSYQPFQRARHGGQPVAQVLTPVTATAMRAHRRRRRQFRISRSSAVCMARLRLDRQRVF
jgi:hypothetical protein